MEHLDDSALQQKPSCKIQPQKLDGYFRGGCLKDERAYFRLSTARE